MLTRILTACLFLLQASCLCAVRAQTKSIEGTYRSSALGYSIQVPRGLKGITGDQSGPERGVKIPLPSNGTITVFGEPNSLEYATPAAGVKDELTLKDCGSSQRDVEPSPVGKLKGAKGRLVCGDRVLVLRLAFRPRGGPIYWLCLETTRAYESQDEAILETVAASFKLIRWK